MERRMGWPRLRCDLVQADRIALNNVIAPSTEEASVMIVAQRRSRIQPKRRAERREVLVNDVLPS